MTIKEQYEQRCSTHSVFGGLIYERDFETDIKKPISTTGSTIAAQIESDKYFDRTCKRNAMQRDTQKKAKEVTENTIK